MTAKELTATILLNRYRRSFCLPCYTPSGWWECDIFEITKSGYFREYEVKTSIADFRADAKKTQKKFWWRGDRQQGGNKHELLADHSTRGPVQFWFVTPAGLIPLEEIPEWAGLIEIKQGAGRWGNLSVERQVKKAPRLHREKAPEQIKTHAESVVYYRLMNELTRKGAA